jgi:hypothetical protein
MAARLNIVTELRLQDGPHKLDSTPRCHVPHSQHNHSLQLARCILSETEPCRNTDFADHMYHKICRRPFSFAHKQSTRCSGLQLLQ